MTKHSIYLAGGCFWGVEAYFMRIAGVLATRVGYANSNQANPDYKSVCSGTTNAAEAIELIYDTDIISLGAILQYYFRIIDPTSINRQGNDKGSQYRTGIYYTDPTDEPIIRAALNALQADYPAPIVVENQALANFYPAEDYHQHYLAKNPNGYCHINVRSADTPLNDTEQQRATL